MTLKGEPTWDGAPWVRGSWPTPVTLVGFVLLSLLVGVTCAFFPEMSIYSVAVTLMVLITILETFGMAMAFFWTLLSLGGYAGSWPVAVGGVRFFAADYFLVILLVLLFKKNGFSFRSPVSVLLLIYIGYGLFCLLNGLFYQGHDFNRVMGEFRRFFFYPLSFFLGLNLVRQEKDIGRWGWTFSLAPPVILIFASMRIITRFSWAAEIHRTPEDFRAFAYYEGIVLLFVFAYFLSRYLFLNKLNLYQFCLAAVIPFFLFFSGFRLLWGLFGLSIAVLLWLYYQKKDGNRKSLRIAVSLLLLLLVSLASFRALGGEYYQIMKRKAIERVFNLDKNTEIWRYHAWGESLRRFGASPVFGTGLGDELTFWTLSSKGKWFQTTHPSHNVILDLLYQTGAIGALLFMMIVIRSVWFIYHGLRKAPLRSTPLLAALFIFFVCGLIQSLFQPYFNQPANAIFFFASMGIATGTIELSPRPVEQGGGL